MRGVFQESFSFAELKYMARIVIVMHMIDIAGHALLRYMTHSIVDKHIGLNEEQYALQKKKVMDDYLVQKDYFKAKKDNKL
eukprot:CAMPEP_0176380636 /NCGR_PEP_ID=MMETSP0126-20121128/31282_1 /TAXON_ID=141414 ORGANISM="Strombidinopsis acuminatum, Strain SPMC142" /NCGR_SAMPLE_ID=MMETSP0126 /ASSEMBLY_ACC=CAM_ASM_000229 /LENGTH=80 /DNA_ID=CAMNT_0017744063 /DNA_START=245 /DNA_END=487 /DNA_ORIENTATION=+